MKEEIIDQISIDDLGNNKAIEVEIQNKVAVLFDDPTSLEEVEKGNFVAKPLPDEVKKGRSRIIDDMIAVQNPESEVTIEIQEISEITKAPVTSRVSLSFDRDTADALICSRALTNFDREVIDAVSTLASITQIMTASDIYRVITGKDGSVTVNKNQRNRVEESMRRCQLCLVKIDYTSEFQSIPELASAQFSGPAISFEAVEVVKGRGTNTFYKILVMPPFYRFAERLGKISKVPLRLLDSPVSKTDNIIAAQSYLLREIDIVKKCRGKHLVINWDAIYRMTSLEGKRETRQENKRTRDIICKILDFWVDEEFIVSYETIPRKNTIEIVVNSHFLD